MFNLLNVLCTALATLIVAILLSVGSWVRSAESRIQENEDRVRVLMTPENEIRPSVKVEIHAEKIRNLEASSHTH